MNYLTLGNTAGDGMKRIRAPSSPPFLFNVFPDISDTSGRLALLLCTTRRDTKRHQKSSIRRLNCSSYCSTSHDSFRRAGPAHGDDSFRTPGESLSSGSRGPHRRIAMPFKGCSCWDAPDILLSNFLTRSCYSYVLHTQQEDTPIFLRFQ